MKTDENPYAVSNVTGEVGFRSDSAIEPASTCRLLMSVCAASVLGGFVQGISTATIYATLDLGADTLPMSALSGLAMGSLLALFAWAAFQLNTLRGLSLSNRMVMSVVLIVTVPAAASVAIALFQTINATVPSLTDEVELALSIGGAAIAFYAINLSALQVALIAMSNGTDKQPSS